MAGLLQADAVAVRNEVRVRLALDEAGAVSIVRHAGGDLVPEAEDLALVGELRRESPVLGDRLRRAERSVGLALELAVGRCAVRVDESIRRSLAIAQMDDLTRRGEGETAGLVVDAGDLDVAVRGAALRVPVEPVGRSEEVVGQPLAAADVHQVHQVVRLVGKRVDGPAILRQQALRGEG